MVSLIEYTLPEWVFLDAQSHEGNLLAGRTCIMHVPTRCIIEMISMDDVMVSEIRTTSYDFTYTNRFGIVERHKAAVHIFEQEDVQGILVAASEWYCMYMRWEDENIEKGLF